MLRSLKDLEGYAVSATDGYIGSVANFLLDDERWTVRYLVVETGGFFSGRRVLISPISFRQVHWSSTLGFHVALTKDKVKNSPSVDADKPVSRQHELDWFGYYGYPRYWGYSGLWGTGAYPGLLAAGSSNEAPAEQTGKSGDVHLRSAKEIRGYHIEGTDAAIGHVDDFIIDDETWEVRWLVIDTRNWWLEKKVLVAPHWASRISWAEKKVFVDLSRQAIKNSPEWNPSAPINREYEARLCDYYKRPVHRNSGDRPVEAAATDQHSGSHAR
jgi:sporulation protein YlmC with PRC-barrel domain